MKLEESKNNRYSFKKPPISRLWLYSMRDHKHRIMSNFQNSVPRRLKLFQNSNTGRLMFFGMLIGSFYLSMNAMNYKFDWFDSLKF